MGLLSRANNLAFYELLGDAQMINNELDKYHAVTAGFLQETAKEFFRPDNSNTLFYRRREL
jgi:zinc protease